MSVRSSIDSLAELLPLVHKGKVRDVYALGSEHLVMVTSDRLSAFDRVLTEIPGKGQILDALTWYWIDILKPYIRHAYVKPILPGVSLVRRAEMLPIEVVVRQYLCGSGWREYQREGTISSVLLPTGLKEFDRLPEIIVTPSTKSAVGEHDEPVSLDEIVRRGLMTQQRLDAVIAVAKKIFLEGQRICAQRGILLVDTKYEFGLIGEELFLSDEVHTPDSSRFWDASSYEQRIDPNIAPQMLDKEVIRRWLMLEHKYLGEGIPPNFTSTFKEQCAKLYLDLAQRFLPNFSLDSGVMDALEDEVEQLKVRYAIYS